MLQINQEKMSKSLGNFLLLRDVLKTTDARVLRMLMLQTHYRSPLDFSDERLDEAASSLERVENFIDRMDWLVKHPVEGEGIGTQAFSVPLQALREGFVAAMDDDFNTAGALGALFSCINDVNAALGTASLGQSDIEAASDARDAVVELFGVFGIDVPGRATDAQDAYPAEVVALAREIASFAGDDAQAAVEALLETRAQARASKMWAVADAVRDGMGALGFVIEDTPQGAKVTYEGNL